MRAVYVAPPSPKSKANRSSKCVRFNENVRVRIIERAPEEDVSLSAWLASLPENIASKSEESSESDESGLSTSPPRKLHRVHSPPLQTEEKKQSPSFFPTSIFKAFETHSHAAVRCR